MKFSLLLIVVMLLSGCASDPTVLVPVRYANLVGWGNERHAESLALFVDSCKANQKKLSTYAATQVPIDRWRDVCKKALVLMAERQVNDADARRFFESHFTPHRVMTRNAQKGRITGYYEPLLKGSFKRGGIYQTPVYGLPPQTQDRLRTRMEIESGALDGSAPVLLYVDDPVMLFFLHIQGSGKVRLPSGEAVGLQYAGKNDQPYVAIGRVLKERGDLETVTMQTIRDWLYAHPSAAAEVMNQNPSYVYFSLTDGSAYAKGAQGLSLTPQRSIAVDDERASYGVPTYIVADDQPMISRLFVAQDTGGALMGPHRIDIFFGQGDAAEQMAGQQNALAEVYWLLPTTLEK